MALTLGPNDNDNGIFVGGPVYNVTMKVSAGETIYPGQPVTIGAAAGEIAAADADDDVILGIALENTQEGVEDFRTAYAAGEYATVGMAPGMFYMGRVADLSGGSIAAGVIVKSDASGNLVAADPTVDEFDEVVGRVINAVTTNGAVGYTLVRYGGL